MSRFLRFQLVSFPGRLQPLWLALQGIGRGLLDLVLPPRCLHCDVDLPAGVEILLCPKCIQAIAPPLAACCGRCGAMLPDGVAATASCPACKDFALQFHSVYPLGRYEGALRELVLETKRLSAEAVSLAIGRLMALRLGEKLAAFRPDALLPVPMHWAKRLVRGVNSPDLLAEVLGRKLGVPVVHSLARTRYTGPQKNLLPRELPQCSGGLSPSPVRSTALGERSAAADR